jgi:hypothetical protein
MNKRSSFMTAPRMVYLSAGIVVSAALLHSMLLPLAKYQQVEPAMAYLHLLDQDMDTDGIADYFDRAK